jgi:hypothetical protein
MRNASKDVKRYYQQGRQIHDPIGIPFSFSAYWIVMLDLNYIAFFHETAQRISRSSLMLLKPSRTTGSWLPLHHQMMLKLQIRKT